MANTAIMLLYQIQLVKNQFKQRIHALITQIKIQLATPSIDK